MTDKSKRVMTILIATVFVVFLVALVAVGAYAIGRNSTIEEDRTLTEVVDRISDTIQDGGASEDPDNEVEKVSPQNQSIEKEDQNSTDSANGASNSSEAATGEAQQSGGESQVTEPEIRIPVDLEEVDTELMLDVWEIINEEFDGALPSSSDVTYRAIIGSMELLDDQFTRFIPPEIAERSRIQIQGGYEGIGAYVDLDEAGNLLIVRPIDGQPADKAGLLSGDIITQVDGQTITGMPLVEIVAMVTGPRGTEVRLTIVREETGETFEITIVRERIEFPVVSSRMLEENIGYVRLSTFSNGADQHLSLAIDELLTQEPIGLILDLRDNPGGLLAEAIDVSDLFLPEGIVAYQRDSQGVERVFESNNGDLAETIPLVLLVNSGSASASEIVAGAVRDLKRGILIGEQTLGKGSVQQSYTLSDGSELRVTIARWYTPNNVTIDKEGILPDIEIGNPVDLGGDDDEQLQRAIQFILEGE
ncbi:MAG: S41 family peptidase [Candidatus Promineifilaceae bacterium]